MENLHPQVGDRVRVRQRTWHVRDVDEGVDARVLTLAGFDVSGAPCDMRVVHPVDDVARVAPTTRRRCVHGRHWRSACRALLRADGEPTAMHRTVDARLEVLPFQLEPALALLGGRGTRLLLADDVGLGKTTQALLCAAELRARAITRRVLVLCPAGLRDQWVSEAAARLQLPFALLDQASVRRLAARLPAEVNPWSVEPLVVTSVDFAKRAEVLPEVASAGWDLVIVDEAHGCCGVSDRQEAVSVLCASAPYVLLLSATPHSGDDAAFSTLCQLGRLDDDLLVFRRTRLEVGRDSGRRVHTVRVRMTDPERRMHAALAALSRAVRREHADLHRSAWLLLTLLHKRALSSPFALAASVERRLRWLDDSAPAAGTQLTLPWDDEAGELDAADAAPPMWQEPALSDTRREQYLLQRLLAAARDAAGAEGKLRRLRKLLRAIREPVIVFTEYRDTLQHVQAQVPGEAVLMHGGLSRDQRRAALESFRARGLLLATDAASEGLNLHAHCRVVINLELPWNPMRLEQRIGRVDRIGQARRVHVFHLIADGTGETRLLSRLSARVSSARARVPAPDPLSGRPGWTEESSARLVVLREEPPALVRSARQAAPQPVMRLEAEARAEATRIGFARALCAGSAPRREPGDERIVARGCGAGLDLETTTLATHARRHRTRRSLLARSLRLFRTRLIDASGRTIATRIDGTLAPATRVDGLDAVQASVAAITAAPAHVHWLDTSRETHQRLAAVRLRRARALAQASHAGRGEQQPGLFDRRVERAWLARASEQHAAQATAEARLTALEAASQVRVSGPELVLVLEPHRGTGQ